MSKFPLSVQNLIDDFDGKFQSIIDDLNALKDIDDHNVAIEKAHGTGNEAIIKDLSSVLTDLKLLSVVFSIRHRNSTSTAMEDLNNAVKLQKFAQHLDDMRKYYAE